MNQNTSHRRHRCEAAAVRGAVAEIAAARIVDGWGQPAQLSILHGSNDVLTASTLGLDLDALGVDVVLAELRDLAADPAGRHAIALVAACVRPQPVRAWLLATQTAGTAGTAEDPVPPQQVTLAVEPSGHGYAAITTGIGDPPAVRLTDLGPDETADACGFAYRCLAALASC
ncbi:hypothetical protein [Actinocatenispora rupis]|uniref:Uncharacterized protein n=1 Tax=Actinocatenispora rupis TaxID=519421 RepID=A0A8J3J287_9ACTN|nr:hypothetical protein [Actinocatenispora rupis]GID10216.1 hypothetical protein Aru02nite_11050 [Actinocatenispora rupis]